MAHYLHVLLQFRLSRFWIHFGCHQINILINSKWSAPCCVSCPWHGHKCTWHTLHVAAAAAAAALPALKSIQFEFKTHFIALQCCSNCLSNLSVCPSVYLSVSLSGHPAQHWCDLPRCPRTWGCRSSRDYYPILSRHLYRRASIASSNRYLWVLTFGL